MKQFVLVLALSVAGGVPAGGSGAATSPVEAIDGGYVIQSGHPETLVCFESHAPMESFEGTTRKVTGRILFDPAAIGDSVTVEVEVDLATLDTGIALRNRHMRENHLETDAYPTAVFRGGRVTGRSADAVGVGDTVTLELAGTFTLHGVTRELTVPVTLTRRESVLAVGTHFDVHLSDYEIARPRFLLLKLDEVQNVTVQLIVVPGE